MMEQLLLRARGIDLRNLKRKDRKVLEELIDECIKREIGDNNIFTEEPEQEPEPPVEMKAQIAFVNWMIDKYRSPGESREDVVERIKKTQIKD